MQPDFRQKNRLLTVLKNVPSLAEPAQRDDLQRDLPERIRDRWQRRSALHADIRQLLDVCANYEAGLEELFQRLYYHEGETIQLKRAIVVKQQIVKEIELVTLLDGPQIDVTLLYKVYSRFTPPKGQIVSTASPHDLISHLAELASPVNQLPPLLEFVAQLVEVCLDQQLCQVIRTWLDESLQDVYILDEVLCDELNRRLQAEPDGPVQVSVQNGLVQLIDDMQFEAVIAQSVFKQLRYECWPQAATVPHTLTSTVLVHEQADRAVFDDGWHPILELAERLARHSKCDAHLVQFTGWVDQQTAAGQPLEVDPTVVQARRTALDEETRRKDENTDSPYVYVIVVPHKENVNAKGQVGRRYHLFVTYNDGSGKEEFWHSDESGPLTEKSFCGSLHGILQTQTIPKSTHFEFFLPIELLSWDIDAWPVWDNDFVTLGARYPITVRMVERLLEPQKQKVCADSWQSYLQQPPDDDFHFLIDDAKYSRLRPLYAKLRQGNPISLGVRLPLDAMTNGQDIFRVLLEVGTPVAVWSRSTEQLCARSRCKIEEMVTQHVRQDNVAKAAFDLRLDAFAQEDEDSSHPGTHLLHMVDNPSRIPKNLNNPLFEPRVVV